MDDSLIAPEYKVDRVGWQGRSSSKQSSRHAQQRHQDNKNDAADDNDADGGETSANISEYASHDKDGESEDDNPKRRRRGRRGGRRRRRRNEEGAQAGGNLSTQDNLAIPTHLNCPSENRLKLQVWRMTSRIKRSHRPSQSADEGMGRDRQKMMLKMTRL